MLKGKTNALVSKRMRLSYGCLQDDSMNTKKADDDMKMMKIWGEYFPCFCKSALSLNTPLFKLPY